MASFGPDWRARRHPGDDGRRYFLTAGAALLAAWLLHSVVLGASDTAPGPQQFEVKQALLTEAAPRASSVLKQSVLVTVPAGHPARRVRVSLAMPVAEPNDLLNALAAAYGLRWLNGGKPGQVLLVDKRDFRTTSRGLRQAVADAMPPDLRGAIVGERIAAQQRREGFLKELTPEQLQSLEAATAGGALPIDKLDPSLARPVGRYVQAFSSDKLGAACDLYLRDLQATGSRRLHYGANQAGTKQSSFDLGNGRWLAVDPE